MRPTFEKVYVRTEAVPVREEVEQKRLECLKIRGDIRDVQGLAMEARGMHLQAWIDRILGGAPSGYDVRLMNSAEGFLNSIEQAASCLHVELHNASNRPINYHIYDYYDIYETYRDKEGVLHRVRKGQNRMERREIRSHCLPGF